MKSIKILFTAFFAVLIFTSCNNEPTTPIPPSTSPEITALTPSSFLLNDIIKITGTNFGAMQGSSVVYFDEIIAPYILNWSDTEITVMAPEINKSGKVIIETTEGISYAFAFTLDDGPRILAAGNGRANGEQDIHIEGINFGNTQGSVYFGNLEATKINSWTDSKIKVQVPYTTTSGMIYVKTASKTSKGFYLTIATQTDPFVYTLQPATVTINDVMKIVGRNFGQLQEGSYVDFNGLHATDYVFWTKDSIKVKVPVGASTGMVRVYVGSQASNTFKISVVYDPHFPQISNISTSGFKIGDEITVFGNDFGTTKRTDANVLFNGFPGTEYTMWSDNTIKVIVPPTAVTGKLLVKIGDNTSNTFDYTIIQ